MTPNHEKKVIIMWIRVYSNWNMNFNSEKSNRRSFSYDTKASISLIPMRRMSLWCPIMKWNEITIWIYVCPNWKMYFNSKIGNKRSFSFETKASISLTPMRRMCLWFQSWRERRLLPESMFIPIERHTSILKLVIRKVFIMKPKHQYH